MALINAISSGVGPPTGAGGNLPRRPFAARVAGLRNTHDAAAGNARMRTGVGVTR